jgi:hypothetical protein
MFGALIQSVSNALAPVAYNGDEGIMRPQHQLGVRFGKEFDSSVKQELRLLENMPHQVSQHVVVQNEQRAAELAQTSKLMQQLAVSMEKQRQEAVKIYKIQSDNHKKHMAASVKIAAIDADHGKALLEAGLGIATQAHQLRGTQAAYEGAKSLVG